MKTAPSHLLALLLALTSTTHAQSATKVAWETLPGYDNLPQCLQYIFNSEIYYADTPQKYVGCGTNDCLCQPHRIASNIPMVYSQASKACSNTEDAKSATAILDQYCSANGYMSRVEVGAITTGACACTTTVTETVTEFREKSGGGLGQMGARASKSILRRFAELLIPAVVGLL